MLRKASRKVPLDSLREAPPCRRLQSAGPVAVYSGRAALCGRLFTTRQVDDGARGEIAHRLPASRMELRIDAQPRAGRVPPLSWRYPKADRIQRPRVRRRVHERKPDRRLDDWRRGE